MSQLIKFPSIEQLRHCVATVRARASHHNEPLPKLVFHGTPKLHGTNASVCFDQATGEFWCQSRETIITPEQDNSGFARRANEMNIRDALQYIIDLYRTDDNVGTICVYGEWCGKGIMKGVAISQLEKMFVIFGVKLVTPAGSTGMDLADLNEMDAKHPGWDEPETKWMTTSFSNLVTPEALNSLRIFDINQFKSWDITVDFSDPEASVEELTKYTHDVELECPVGKHFGVEKGLGEGIVWACSSKWFIEGGEVKTSDLRFKTKGEKHKESAHEKIEVDPVKVATIKAFVEGVATVHRFEKMVEKLTIAGVKVVPQNTPEFLKLVGQDVLKEEEDVLAASGLDRKDVMKQVGVVARNWWLKLCKDQPLY